MELEVFRLTAYNKSTGEEIVVGTYISKEDAYDFLMYGLDWQVDAVKSDWFFQVIEDYEKV